MTTTPLDAAQFVAMEHQVGGHSTAKTSLRAHNGRILKPFQSKQRGEREHSFYQRVFEGEAPGVSIPLRSLIPRYEGMIVVTEDEESAGLHAGKYLVLEDLTWGRSRPCIMDVKVGTRSYEDGASAEKIAYEQSKFPLQPTLGLRVQGIKALDAASSAYMEHDKHAGRGVQSHEDLVALFARYFPLHDSVRSRALLTCFLTRLEAFESWFATQEEHEFIASSLLFLYDGEPTADAERAPDIRLIDFAHVQQAASRRDEGVLLGIRTIQRCFRELLAQLQQSENSLLRHGANWMPAPGAVAVVAPSKPESTREHWLRELQALLREHEPSGLPHAHELLAAYAGMERELVQCYRHFYTGQGGFRVAASAPSAAESETFSLPREAIDTFLRIRLRARRSNSFASKGDGVRDAEAVPASAASRQRTPRQRAASTSAVRVGL
ncbi:hypothetical protein ATCC90586_005979 [Pythium insidiosum]|nr:hypothetical protein ATCC90586_005979 [Pythium insidiosum]